MKCPFKQLWKRMEKSISTSEGKFQVNLCLKSTRTRQNLTSPKSVASKNCASTINPHKKKTSHIHPCVSNLPLFHPAFRLLRPFGHFQDGHGHLPAASLATGVDQRPKGDAVGRQLLELHLLPQQKRMAPGSLTGTSQRRFFSSDTRNIPPVYLAELPKNEIQSL